MDLVETFISYCITVCKRYEGREVDYHLASKSIIDASQKLPQHIHPMVRDIVLYAGYLGEDWCEEDQAEDHRMNWDDICKLLDDYTHNRWRPTFWCLMATYLQSNDGKIVAGYAIRINRTQGRVEVLTGNEILRGSVNEIMRHLDNRQTDEWFLQNLSRSLPKEVDGLVFAEVAVSEELLR